MIKLLRFLKNFENFWKCKKNSKQIYTKFLSNFEEIKSVMEISLKFPWNKNY